MTQSKYLEYDDKYEDYYEEEEPKKVRKPGDAPDGGWGWMVVVGAFLCCLFIEGLHFSFADLQEEIGDYYEVSTDTLQSTGVLMAAFTLLGGPLASGLVKKFNHRKVTMAGSCVTCISLLVSTQMPNVPLLRFTYGVLAGIGLSMVSMPSIAIVAVWFKDKRAFATGVAVMGAGAGVFIFGPLNKHLLENNDWKNAVVIVAAMFLNCAVAGALFRSLNHEKPKGMKRGVIQRGAIMKALIAEKERQRTISNGSLDNCIITRDNKLIKIDKIDLRNKSTSYINRIKETFGFSSRSLNKSKNSLVLPKVVVDPISRPKSPRMSNKCVTPKAASSPPTPKRDSGSDSGCGSLEDSPKLRSHSYESLPVDDPWDRNLVVKLPPKDTLGVKGSASARNVTTLNSLDSPSTSPVKRAEEKLDPSFLANNVSPNGSCHSLNTPVSSSVPGSKTNSLRYPMPDKSVMTLQECTQSVEIYKHEEPTNCKPCRKLCDLLELQLLKSRTFLLLVVAGSLTMSGYVIPFVHLPKKAMSLGISKEQSLFLVSVVWVANMISRLIMGWIADRPWGNPIQLNNITLVLAGLLSFFSSTYGDNGALVFYAVFFGIFTASFITLRSIILIELFGKDHLVCSYGLLMFFQGFGLLLGHGLSGVVDGDNAFYVVGTFLTAAGILGFPLRRLRLWENKRAESQQGDNQFNIIQGDNEFQIIGIEEIPPQSEVLKIENCESSI